MNQSSSGVAVKIQSAEKSFKWGSPVLSGLDMSVDRGSIYGLLGSSGCGKTTLLSCILGQQKLDKGNITVFGENPEIKRSGVPGRHVGYMPQEISLYYEFTIREILVYFGGLVGMRRNELNASVKYLVGLFDLPQTNTMIDTLSGGEQRRVSLATAVIHQPRLLILDEPAVGVDPLLRERIWQHLKSLVNTNGSTIILTTHYIEECRQADKIGVMTDGRLLIEEAPRQLFLQYGRNDLEGIILELFKAGSNNILSSAESTMAMNEIASLSNPDTAEKTMGTNSLRSNTAQELKEHGSELLHSCTRVAKLTGKNLIILIRNPILLFFVVVIPALVISLVCLALGTMPINMSLGIVNKELSGQPICQNVTRNPGECSSQYLSCQFLRSIPRENINGKIFETKLDAVESTRQGDTWGYVVIPDNFSERLIDRLLSGPTVDEITFNHSQITICLDETDAPVSMGIKMILYKAYVDFLSTLLTDCGYDSELTAFPLKYSTPLLGRSETDFREFLVPGITAAILFLYSSCTTSIRIIGEKKSGVLARTFASGVKFWEMIAAYFVIELFILISQSVLTYFIIVIFMGMPIMLSHIMVIAIFVLNAFGGAAVGYFIGTLCKEEFEAAMIAIATFFPVFFLSGVLWPLEGMATWLRNVAMVFPCTLSGEAARSVLSRGWDFSHDHVWPGFVIPVAYISLFLIATLAFSKSRHM